jgi:phosphoribosylglycinamide formyltransferase-1
LTITPLRLGFLASRNGSSFRAIVDAIASGEVAGDALLAVSNNRTAPALEFARSRNLPTEVIATQADPDAADARLCEVMDAAGVELIVLSGYLRRLGPRTLGRYKNRVLNIHPGPLPAFGGEGMYGRRVHEAVIAAGVPESEIIIHAVDEIYDNGPILARRPVPLEPGETAASLEARLTALEPGFFVETLRRIAIGELRLPA